MADETFKLPYSEDEATLAHERLSDLLRAFAFAPDDYTLNQMVRDGWDLPISKELRLGDLRFLWHVSDVLGCKVELKPAKAA